MSNTTSNTIPNFSTDLTGDVAFVTGATSGLGERFARVLAKCGAKVVITGRRTERLETLAQQIRAEGGICEPIRLDMTDRDNIKSAVAEAEQKLGLINILVNNAGIPDAQRATKMSDELIDNVFGTNMVGPYVLCCEIARRLMKEKKPGRIVNISSIAAFNISTQSSASLYAITKAGVVRMTEALAVEWAPFHINVNAIAPGAFRTEMTQGKIDRVGDFSDVFPRKRMCEPEQLDSTLLFLVSPSSECVTGTYIKVDDGQSSR